MIVSYQWLKEYVKHPYSKAELAKRLTLAGLEVVGEKRVNTIAKGLVVGEVLTKTKHPNADRLNLVQVAYLASGKKEVVDVVCGADNIDAGQKIVFAPVGVDLGERFVIKRAKIRGIYSNGMVCSKEEVGKEEKSDGIWVLPEQARLQDDLRQFWGNEDTLYDIDLTSNRADCQSIIGVAHEVKALVDSEASGKNITSFSRQGFDISPLATTPKSPIQELAKAKEIGKPGSVAIIKDFSIAVDVQTTKTEVPVYLVRRLKGIKVGSSPDWLSQRLYHHGIRPLNVVVDVTNLMMIEYGQPMHAFDATKIVDEKIIVRHAKKGERLFHLMNSEVECEEEDIVIADAKKPIAFAGVIGGKDSAVVETTTEIVLEAAVFGKASVAATVKRHNLNTDAANFFQRFVCADRTAFALDRAAELIARLAVNDKPANVGESVGRFPARVEVGKTREGIFTPRQIPLSHSHIERVLHKKIDVETVENILASLDFEVVVEEGRYLVTPAVYRPDIAYEWDLIEEVLRLYGYEKVPMEVAAIRHSDYSIALYNERKAKQIASALGFDEVITYPFIETELIESVIDDKSKMLQVRNPMQKNYAFMRSSLIYGMLRSVKLNIERGRSTQLRFSECGHTFFLADDPREKKKYQEKLSIGFLYAIAAETKNSQREDGFLTLKGVVEQFICRWGFSVNEIAFKAARFPYSYDFSSAQGTIEGVPTIELARVNDVFMDFFNLKRMTVFYAEIDLDAIATISKPALRYKPISTFPSIYRDLAVVVKDKTPLGDMVADISSAMPLVRSVKLLEVYKGKGIPKEKKSFVFNIELRAKNKTLHSEQADELVLRIVESLRKKYVFELR